MTERADRVLVHVVRTLWVGVFVFTAIKAVASPNRHSVYPEYAQAAREWPTAGEFEAVVAYQYLPYFGDLFAPFAALPDRLGALAWAVTIFAVYAAGLRAFLRQNGLHGPGYQLALACGLLVGCGSPVNLQANVLVVACWLWAVVAVRRERWWLAAALFALPAFKIYTLATALVFVAIYPRQLGVRLAVAVGGLLALPFAFHPAVAVNHRIATLIPYLASGDHYERFSYQTLYEAWRMYVGDVQAAWLLPVQASLGLAVPLVVLRWRRNGATEEAVERTGLFLGMTWCVSFGPSIEPQTYLIAAPALGWWLARFAFGPRPNRLAATALAVVVALAGSPIYGIGPFVREALIPTRVPFLAMATLHLAALYAAWAQGSARAHGREVLHHRVTMPGRVSPPAGVSG